VLGPIVWDVMSQPRLELLSGLEVVERVVGYADDLVVVINGKSSQDLQDEANHIIGRMTSWCENNKLLISAEKTKYVIFKGKLNFKREPIMKIEGKTI